MIRSCVTTVAVWISFTSSARSDDLPPDLALIPGNGVGFVHVKVGDGLDAAPPELKWAFAGVSPAEWAAFEDRFAFPAGAIDRVLVVIPNPESLASPGPMTGNPTAKSALVAVTFKKPLDPAAFGKSVFKEARTKTYRGKTYTFDDDPWSAALVLPGNQTVVVGSEDAILDLIDRADAKPESGPLDDVRAEAMKHSVVVAVNPSGVVPPGIPEPFAALAKTQRGLVKLDLTAKSVSVEVRLDYADAAGATAGQAALKDTITLARNAMQPAFQQMTVVIDKPGAADRKLGPDEFPERFAALLGFGALRQLDKTLEGLAVEKSGTSVGVALKDIPTSTGSLVLLSMGGITALGKSANSTFRMVAGNVKPAGGGPRELTPEEKRLIRIAKAMEAYHADKGHYPPPAIVGKDGTPLHSWRVALLPYLGDAEKALYKQFKLDEPWDSRHNKKLLAAMPDAFSKVHSYTMNYGRTGTLVVTGPGTVFDPKATVKKGDLADGGANTVLAYEPMSWEIGPEVRQVWWSKPADPAFVGGKPPAIFPGSDFSTVYVVTADGKTRLLTKREDEKRLAELFLRQGKAD